jgi:hypothetical protein
MLLQGKATQSIQHMCVELWLLGRKGIRFLRQPGMFLPSRDSQGHAMGNMECKIICKKTKKIHQDRIMTCSSHAKLASS